MKLTDAKNTKEGLTERFGRLFRKHKAGEILKHLPAIAAILVDVGGLNVPGAAKGIFGLIRSFGKATPNDEREELEESVGRLLVAIVATQKQLSDRCNTLEAENASIRSELARGSQELTLLRFDLQAAKAAVEFLEKRNTYLGWGLLVVGLLALSELARRLVH